MNQLYLETAATILALVTLGKYLEEISNSNLFLDGLTIRHCPIEPPGPGSVIATHYCPLV